MDLGFGGFSAVSARTIRLPVPSEEAVGKNLYPPPRRRFFPIRSKKFVGARRSDDNKRDKEIP